MSKIEALIREDTGYKVLFEDDIIIIEQLDGVSYTVTRKDNKAKLTFRLSVTGMVAEGDYAFGKRYLQMDGVK